jgi:hypothetical protein
VNDREAWIADVSGGRNRGGVAVERKQRSSRAQAREDLSAVPTSSECAIHVHSLCFDRERVNCFLQQNRSMRAQSEKSSSSGGIPSSFSAIDLSICASHLASSHNSKRAP